jgi:hypothetical protein
LFPSQSHGLITVFNIKDEAVVYIITMAQKSVKRKFGDSKLGRKSWQLCMTLRNHNTQEKNESSAG